MVLCAMHRYKKNYLRLKRGQLFGKYWTQKNLAKEGYIKSKFTPELFTHKTREIAFLLVVDDFGDKYIDRLDTEHLARKILKRYPCKSSWELTYYLGMILECNWTTQTLKLLMSGYVKEALLKFQHTEYEVKCY